jgi:glycosyl transferase family 1
MEPRIYYWMYSNRISGGEKHSYEHVDILNDCGFEAYALHLTGKPHTWFNNHTRVFEGLSFWDIYDPKRDYLVLPEPLGASISSLPGKKVVFNKNLYIGFDALGLNQASVRYPYVESEVVAAFAVSNHNYQTLAFTFPKAKLFRMYARINCDMFAYRPLSDKKRRIAVVVKAKEPLSVLYHILNARAQAGLNNLSDYEWTFLRGYTHNQVAKILCESLMLISLSTYEGLPRIILEAMASGCIVISYGTGALKECLMPEYRFEPDDFTAMARRIEEIAKAFPANMESWGPCTVAARKIAEEFTYERQRKHVIEAWERILTSQ